MDRLGLSSATAPRRPASAGGPSAAPVEGEPQPSVPSEASGVARLRWERRRVTFVRAWLWPREHEVASSETGRAMEPIVDKVRCFGGQVVELALGLVAAFDLEPLEDAPRHAASAALAIQKVTAGMPGGDSAWPAVTLTVHTTRVPVGRHPGDTTSTRTRSAPRWRCWRPWGSARPRGGRPQRRRGPVPGSALRVETPRRDRRGAGIPPGRPDRRRARAFHGLRRATPSGTPPRAVPSSRGGSRTDRVHSRRARNREVPAPPRISASAGR